MPPIQVNRRRFLGCSAAAGLAIAQGKGLEGAIDPSPRSLRIGVIGLGNRGTNLLRTLLEFPAVQVPVVCDTEPRHRTRGSGIVEKARGAKPEEIESYHHLMMRDDLDAVVAALPCDLHADLNCQALRAGKHLYAEKPLALSVVECDRVIEEARKARDVVIRVGCQRRWNPRYREGVALMRSGEIGSLLEGRAAWVSSNGPMNGHEGWLAQRSRSGDWMVEQAVHVWDLARWIMGEPPTHAYGSGARNLFQKSQPLRDVTDHYTAMLTWRNGFSLSLVHSWVDPADDAFTGVWQRFLGSEGGIDFATGTVTFRDRSKVRKTLHPGLIADTKFALQSFLEAIAHPTGSVSSLALLEEAKDATLIGLLVRKAVDEQRIVTWDEIASDPHPIDGSA